MTNVGAVLAQHLASFGKLPPSDRDALADLPGEVRRLSRFEDILKDGDRPNDVVIVLSGMLYRHSMSAAGKRQVHAFYLPTEAPCLETLYLDQIDNNLGALVESSVGIIPQAEIYRIIAERPETRKLLWRQTLIQAAIFRTWLIRNSSLPALASFAHLLCEMFLRSRSAGLVSANSCKLMLTQDVVADALGLTTVHTNRTLMLLRQSGAVEWRSRRLTISDWPKLARIAEYDPRYLHLHLG